MPLHLLMLKPIAQKLQQTKQKIKHLGTKAFVTSAPKHWIPATHMGFWYMTKRENSLLTHDFLKSCGGKTRH